MKIIELEYTTLTLSNQVIFACTKEGVVIDMDKHNEVLAIVQQNLIAPYGCILDEQFAYTVNFDVMLAMRDNPDLIAGAVLTHRFTTQKALEFVNPLIKKPVRFFKSAPDAENWVRSYISDYVQNQAVSDTEKPSIPKTMYNNF